MMSSTPEITNVVVNKQSPFGSRINKNLLTPCRRVGLSRKRKTPYSIVKICSEDLNTSYSSITKCALAGSTPLNNKKSSRRSNKVNLDSSALTPVNTINRATILDESKISHQKEGIIVAKKKLLCRFSPELFDELGPALQKEKLSSESFHTVEDTKAALKKIPLDDVPNIVEWKNNAEEKNDNVVANMSKGLSEKIFTGENINFPEIIKRRKIESDSDDDFKSNKTEIKLKQKKSDIKTSKLLRKTSSCKSFGDDKMSNKLKDCKITLQRLSDDLQFSKNGKRTECDQIDGIGVVTNGVCESSDSSGDEHFYRVRRKKVIVLSDEEEDFCAAEKHSIITLVKEQVTSENISSGPVISSKISDPEQILSESNNNSNEISKTTVELLDDDDDAFTSTPDQEKTDKKHLIEKIKYLESQIIENRKKFDNLKQASVYKNKHNIEELREMTNIWKRGCVLGLDSLLQQLLTHGPMDMATLLNNLHIPTEIIAKLPLNFK